METLFFARHRDLSPAPRRTGQPGRTRRLETSSFCLIEKFETFHDSDDTASRTSRNQKKESQAENWLLYDLVFTERYDRMLMFTSLHWCSGTMESCPLWLVRSASGVPDFWHQGGCNASLKFLGFLTMSPCSLWFPRFRKLWGAACLSLMSFANLKFASLLVDSDKPVLSLKLWAIDGTLSRGYARVRLSERTLSHVPKSTLNSRENFDFSLAYEVIRRLVWQLGRWDMFRRLMSWVFSGIPVDSQIDCYIERHKNDSTMWI